MLRPRRQKMQSHRLERSAKERVLPAALDGAKSAERVSEVLLKT
jgi:hypothetical protein